MKINELALDSNAINFLKSQGFIELYPPQEDAVNAGILDGKSILVSAPTASGKTLIAILSMIQHLSKHNTKIVYLSPLRALAAEKFTEFKKLESIKLGRRIKIAISTGDFDLVDDRLESSDILILTNEKMDSMMRNGEEWIDDIGLVISDEIHLIGDESRGPTLEMILTKFKLSGNKPQIVGLSATISNNDEIADWLDCKLVENNWRPVPLSEGVYDGGVVTLKDSSTFEVDSTIPGLPSIVLGVDSIKNGGQSLIFAETRTRSSSLAVKASEIIPKLLKKSEQIFLEKISKDILSNNENTKLITTLALVVKNGVAFHHAGLNQKCRQIIESEFRNGRIKMLTATPTLAAGVNLPARRVIISNISRYDSKIGTTKPISVLEYKQLCGRAGRPQYDDFGESIIIGNSNTEGLIDYYINGEPEPIESKITDQRSLRIHVLSLIVTSPKIKKDEIIEFFSQTFGGVQERTSSIKFGIQLAMRFLLTEEFIINNGEMFVATKFGKKVSRLYIDPLTATYFRDAIENVSKERKHTFGFLHLVVNCDEFFPRFELRKKDYEAVSILIENNSSTLIEPISEIDCSRTLLAMNSWINEGTEISLSEQLNVESGDMHRMVETGNWLTYCVRELSKELGRRDLIEEIEILRQRIRYGIKEELADLVKVKGIGRVRARRLYKAGIKTRENLAQTSVNQLAVIDKIGLTVANNIKSELQKVR